MKKNIKKNIGLGFFTISLWCIVSAFAYVYTSSVEQQLPLAFMCFILFGISTTIFCLLNFKKMPSLLGKCKQHFKTLTTINVTTFGCWFFVIYPLKYIEPSVVNTIILGCIPLCTLGINKYIHHQLIKDKQNDITAILLGGGVLYLIFLSLIGKTTQQGVSHLSIFFSIMSCLLAGFSLSINNIYTKQLSESGFTPLDILAVRFILLILITGIFAFSVGELTTNIKLSILFPIFLVACVLVIIPQIAFQISIRELEPFTVSVFLPLMPVMTFIIESFNEQLHLTGWVFTGILAISMISLGGSILRYRAEKISRATQSLLSNNIITKRDSA